MSSHTDKMRDNTRITFPSTAGSGIPYAILKIAPLYRDRLPLISQSSLHHLAQSRHILLFTSFTAACKFRALE